MFILKSNFICCKIIHTASTVPKSKTRYNEVIVCLVGSRNDEKIESTGEINPVLLIITNWQLSLQWICMIVIWWIFNQKLKP